MTTASNPNVYGRLNRQATQFEYDRYGHHSLPPSHSLPPPGDDDEEHNPFVPGTPEWFIMAAPRVIARYMQKRRAENAEAAKNQTANADKPVPAPMWRMSEEEDNQSRAFTQQCFAAAFDFGTPNRTYLSHQFGTQFDSRGGGRPNFRSPTEVHPDVLRIMQELHQLYSTMPNRPPTDEELDDNDKWSAIHRAQIQRGRAPTIGPMDSAEDFLRPTPPANKYPPNYRLDPYGIG